MCFLTILLRSLCAMNTHNLKKKYDNFTEKKNSYFKPLYTITYIHTLCKKNTYLILIFFGWIYITITTTFTAPPIFLPPPSHPKNSMKIWQTHHQYNNKIMAFQMIFFPFCNFDLLSHL